MNIGYRVQTTVVSDSAIMQQVSTVPDVHGAYEILATHVIRLGDEQLRAALVKMGWTPPGEASKPIARLEAHVSDRPFSKGETFFDVVILDRERAADGMELFAGAAPAAPAAEPKGFVLVPVNPPLGWADSVIRHYQPHLDERCDAYKEKREELLHWHKAITATALAAPSQPAEPVAQAQQPTWEAIIIQAAQDAKEVFKESCNHTHEAIDYMKAVLLAHPAAEQAAAEGERSKFEALARDRGLDLSQVQVDGNWLYSDCNTDFAWWGFQAARRPVRELTDAKPEGEKHGD